MLRAILRSAVIVSLVLMVDSAYGAPKADDFFPNKPDPFVGNYSGRWSDSETIDPEIHAQVIALGSKKYRVVFTAKLDMRSTVKDAVEAKRSGKSISFKGDHLYGEIRGDRFTGGRGSGEARFEMKKVSQASPTLGAKPPEGAVVLFDGSNMDEWESPIGWKVLDNGAMMVTPLGVSVHSKRKFKDAHLHIEFRNSFMPKARGQGRSNSGVFLQDIYEVQILDSYGLEGYYNECGALYKLSAPHVNACRPPLQWQTYDIDYTAPKFDKEGRLSHFGRMTVLHNGVLIHNNQELSWITAWKEEDRLAEPPKEAGPIQLQAHSNFVQFRNIWIVPGN